MGSKFKELLSKSIQDCLVFRWISGKLLLKVVGMGFHTHHKWSCMPIFLRQTHVVLFMLLFHLVCFFSISFFPHLSPFFNLLSLFFLSPPSFIYFISPTYKYNIFSFFTPSFPLLSSISHIYHFSFSFLSLSFFSLHLSHFFLFHISILPLASQERKRMR